MPPLAKLGALIKLAREGKGLTIREVAAISGHDKDSISKAERGRMTNINTLDEICQAVDTRLLDLWLQIEPRPAADCIPKEVARYILELADWLRSEKEKNG